MSSGRAGKVFFVFGIVGHERVLFYRVLFRLCGFRLCGFRLCGFRLCGFHQCGFHCRKQPKNNNKNKVVFCRKSPLTLHAPTTLRHYNTATLRGQGRVGEGEKGFEKTKRRRKKGIHTHIHCQHDDFSQNCSCRCTSIAHFSLGKIIDLPTHRNTYAQQPNWTRRGLYVPWPSRDVCLRGRLLARTRAAVRATVHVPVQAPAHVVVFAATKKIAPKTRGRVFFVFTTAQWCLFPLQDLNTPCGCPSATLCTNSGLPKPSPCSAGRCSSR